ncbi:MAG: WYL domain-containing transcriptional regulator, partial [Planctomycetota bacterium]|nr:WYL domain-containing transcriptional regulator [Planctomycetota bacterium]
MKKAERLLTLILLLQRRHGCKAADIAQELGVAERTVYRDIGSVNEIYQGRIYVECTEAGYRLSASADTPPLSLTDEELDALRTEADASPDSTPHGQRLKQAVSKIVGALKDNRSQSVEHLLTVSPSSVRDLVDWRKLKRLEDAIREKAQLRMDYYSFRSDETRQHLFDPFALTYRKQFWYVVGHSHRDRDVRTLRASRIKRMSKSGRSFEVPSDFSLDEYFKGSWEVFTGDPVTVKLCFSTRATRLVEEVRWHDTQKLSEATDGRLCFEAEMPLSPELTSWVLSWGSDCEVIDPPALRDEVKHELKRLL